MLKRRRERERGKQVVRELLRDLVSSDDCYMDHNGNCQMHLWFGERTCPQARLKRLLEKLP